MKVDNTVIAKTLNRAIESHKEGNLEEAKFLYSSILEHASDHPDANHNMGVLLSQLDKNEEAISFLRKAVKSDPRTKQYWLSLININLKTDKINTANILIKKAKDHGHDIKWQNKSKNFSEQRSEKINKGPPQQSIDALLKFYEDSKFDQAISEANILLKLYPSSTLLLNVIGACKSKLNDYDSALNWFGKALELEPNSAPVYNNIANLYLQTQNFEQALEHFNEAIKIDAKSLPAMIGLGNTFRKVGRLNEAVEVLTSAVQTHPESAAAHNNLANVYIDKKDTDKAILSYQLALKIDPAFSKTLLNLGKAYVQKGEISLAIKHFEEAIQKDALFAEAYNSMGEAYLDQLDHEKSLSYFKTAIKIEPDFYAAWANLGNAYYNLENYEKAQKCLKTAIEIYPNFPEAHNNLGNTSRQVGKLSEAIQHYLKAIKLNPDLAAPHNGLGQAYRDIGLNEKAHLSFLQALELDKFSYEVHNNIGNILQDIGDSSGAQDNYRKAIEINPSFITGHRHLSSLTNYRKSTKHLKQLESLKQSSFLTQAEQSELNFALGKAYNDRKEYQLAFEHYRLGNKFRKKLLNYNIKEDKRLFLEVEKIADTLEFDQFNLGQQTQDPKVIFILGMPRSGTTLIEQIISSHYNVEARGEREVLYNFGNGVIADKYQLTSENLSIFRQDYLSSLKSDNPAITHFTDKLPLNFLFIPLIIHGIPDSKIIHVTRNKMATCWSNFIQYFPAKSMRYCYSLDDINSYYKMYTSLMQIWKRRYPDRLVEVKYEDLTVDPETEIERLIANLDLSWDPNCLRPEKNKRGVKTASQMQIRKKIYTGSSEIWKNYRQYIDSYFQ